MGTERDKKMKKSKTKSAQHVYLVLMYVRQKAQRSKTQYRGVGQGTAPHRTASHGAALRCWAT